MGKKRIITEGNQNLDLAGKPRPTLTKKKLVAGVLHVEITYNNTRLTLADQSGNVYAWSSSGALGFRGAKKGTPFAASKVAETIAEYGQQLGLKEVDIVVRGVGTGRESAVRSFLSRGFSVNSIRDVTPMPFNGPRPPKPRRV